MRQLLQAAVKCLWQQTTHSQRKISSTARNVDILKPTENAMQLLNFSILNILIGTFYVIRIWGVEFTRSRIDSLQFPKRKNLSVRVFQVFSQESLNVFV